MQFEVNGQLYFLNFAEQQGRWFVFKPTPAGVEVMPVYVDAVKYERFGVVPQDGTKISN